MSELRSVLDEMKSADNGFLSAAELNGEIVELCRGLDQIQVLIAEKTGALVESGGLVELGFSSVTAFLMVQGRMTAGRARKYATRIKARESAPIAHAAWSDGRVSSDQANHLFGLAESVSDVFPEAESRLVEIVEGLSVRDTGRVLEYWRQSVDGPGDADLEAQMLRRGLSLSGSVAGMRRVDGWMTDLAGEAFETALEAHMAAPAEDDTRSPRQRRHDALEELANCHLTHQHLPDRGGERHQIQVLTDLPALRGTAGGIHESTSRGQILDVEMVRLLACDSTITRIVFGADSEIIDVGRKTRVWTTAQRRAVVARDRHCTWEGCERPARWTDIHHAHHWADGGETSVDNGVLLCRFHHVLTHLDQARIRRKRRTTG